MAMIGRHLPTVTLSHQYLVMEDVPELKARKERLPLLRDPDVSYYLRQERDGLLLSLRMAGDAHVARWHSRRFLVQPLERRPGPAAALYRGGSRPRASARPRRRA